MDIQLFIVIIAGILAGLILVRAAYRFFTGRGSSRCGGCDGCDVRKRERPPS